MYDNPSKSEFAMSFSVMKSMSFVLTERFISMICGRRRSKICLYLTPLHELAATVLRWPLHFDAESIRNPQHPFRLAQELSCY